MANIFNAGKIWILVEETEQTKETQHQHRTHVQCRKYEYVEHPAHFADSIQPHDRVGRSKLHICVSNKNTQAVSELPRSGKGLSSPASILNIVKILPTPMLLLGGILHSY